VLPGRRGIIVEIFFERRDSIVGCNGRGDACQAREEH
jgi:hypothetical protein